MFWTVAAVAAVTAVSPFLPPGIRLLRLPVCAGLVMLSVSSLHGTALDSHVRRVGQLSLPELPGGFGKLRLPDGVPDPSEALDKLADFFERR